MSEESSLYRLTLENLLLRGFVLPLQIQRADTSLTDLIARHIEAQAKLQRFLAIDDVGESPAVDVSYHGVEETRTHVSRRLNHCRDPRCIAARSDILGLAEVGAKVLDDAPQFLRRFHNKSGIKIWTMFGDELLDFGR